MAKKTHSKKLPLPPSLSQPTFSVTPVPAVHNPPPAAPNFDVKGKGKAKSEGQSRTSHAESRTSHSETTPQLLNPLSVRFQAPVRWIYNYDHTDPLNFGFMFPVEPGSSTELSPLSIHPVSSTLSPSASAPGFDSSSNTAFVSRKSSVEEKIQWDQIFSAVEPPQLQSGSSDQQNLAISSYEGQFPIHQNLPHRYSPHFDIPVTAPAQQFVPPLEEQIWFLPPHGTSVPEEFHDSIPDSRGWLLDGSSYAFQPQSVAVSSGSFVAQQPTVTASAPLKRKRSSYGTTSTMTPYRNTFADRQDSTLCSRCKIYEKMNNFPGLCSSCLQVSFNTSPSALGTRNENLESLVLFLVPSHMEEVMILAPPTVPRSRSWRMLPANDQREYNFSTLVFQDRWTLSKQQAESTRLFGEDYAELANIAQSYQLSLPRPNKCLEASCTVLITVCELYKSFVNISANHAIHQTLNIPKLINNIRTARITIRHVFQQIQALSVSPSSSRDRQDWFPAFLSASIMAVTAVIFLDILVACPSPYREQIWGVAWHDRIVEMRNGGYGMLISLWKASSRGVNPLKLDIWETEARAGASDPFINVTPESYSPEDHSAGANQGKKRRKTNKVESERARQPSSEMAAQRANELRERNILLGINSPAALEGMLALKTWYLKYHYHLKQGEDMFSKSLFMLATMKPVAGLWRIFELE